MTFSEEQVEWIVAEVLRRLGVADGRMDGHERSSSPGRELQMTERVITLRSIEGRLNGVARLIVPPKAIITPAVRDELKSRKIQLATSTSP